MEQQSAALQVWVFLKESEQWHGRPASAVVQLPPLATVWFRHTPD